MKTSSIPCFLPQTGMTNIYKLVSKLKKCQHFVLLSALTTHTGKVSSGQMQRGFLGRNKAIKDPRNLGLYMDHFFPMYLSIYPSIHPSISCYLLESKFPFSSIQCRLIRFLSPIYTRLSMPLECHIF